MIRHTIASDVLTVSIRALGAELCSIRDCHEVEYMWQADPAVWSRHAPILFPMVGKLRGDAYRYRGTEYRMGQHGFARDRMFSLEEEHAGYLRYRLVSDDHTRAMYPFEFALDVTYRLDGATLYVSYEVQNPGPDDLWFAIGAHPGFSCRWMPGDRLQDCYLEFGSSEPLTRTYLENSMLTERQAPVRLDADRRLFLSESPFKEGALIFNPNPVSRVSLGSRSGPRRVEVLFDGFPQLGLWAVPGAPFVCIEPWYGHGDTVGHDGEWTRKPGLLHLAPCSIFRCTHSIHIVPASSGR